MSMFPTQTNENIEQNEQQENQPTHVEEQDVNQQNVDVQGIQPNVEMTRTTSPQEQPAPIVHQEYLNGNVNGWLIQWRQKRDWNICTPKIKECKKKKDSYSDQFQSTLYKAPYKYHINVQSNGMKIEESVIVQISLNFENGDNIQHCETSVLSNGSREVKVQKFEKLSYADSSEVTVGPFQFNVCSFRQNGRKFRLVLHLFASPINMPTLVCSIISPPFKIRAKKPIKNPGTRRKRRKEMDGNLKELGHVNKKRKISKTQTLTEHIKQEQGNALNPPEMGFSGNGMMQDMTDRKMQQNRYLNKVVEDFQSMANDTAFRTKLLSKLLENSNQEEINDINIFIKDEVEKRKQMVVQQQQQMVVQPQQMEVVQQEMVVPPQQLEPQQLEPQTMVEPLEQHQLVPQQQLVDEQLVNQQLQQQNQQ